MSDLKDKWINQLEWARDNEAGITLDHAEVVELIAAIKERPTPHADPRVSALVKAATPFYAAVFNDNGDVTISTGHITTDDWLALDRVLAQLKEPVK